MGEGAERHIEDLEKGTQNVAEQEVTLDRTYLLSRLIVLSRDTWAKS